MDASAFWNLIATTKTASEGDCERQAQLVEQRLIQLPLEEIQSFHRLLYRFLQESYEDRLWAAAYLINGGCSDDGFDYFRGWLIAQGEAVFHAALRDPDTLADVIATQKPPLDDVYECEDLLYAGWHAYEAKTGQEIPTEETPLLDLTGKQQAEDAWEDGGLKEAYAQQHLPKLWATFGW